MAPTKQEKGIRARQQAIKALLAENQERFDELHAKYRLEAGLSSRPAGPSVAELEEKVARQRQRLEKWEQELKRAQR